MEEAIQGKRVVLLHIHQGRMYPQEKCLVQPLQWWAESAPPHPAQCGQLGLLVLLSLKLSRLTQNASCDPEGKN